MSSSLTESQGLHLHTTMAPTSHLKLRFLDGALYKSLFCSVMPGYFKLSFCAVAFQPFLKLFEFVGFLPILMMIHTQSMK